MMDANAFLKRMLLLAAISAFSVVNAAYAHGGGGHGTGGSSGGGSASSGSSSSSGHSGSSTSSGHSGSSTSGGHSATASKGSRSVADPNNSSQSGVTARTVHEGRFRVFVQPGRSTGYNSQNTGTNNEDWKRKHQRLLFGFIRY
jgi:hypothetical protein